MRAFRFPSLFLPAFLGVAAACLSTEPDNLPPLVTIMQPENQHVVDVGDVVEIFAEASDDDGVVTSVEFYVDGLSLGRDFERPFSQTWDTGEATRFSHLIRVVAEDDDGAQTTHSASMYTSWVYAQPETVTDGWETAALEAVGMDAAPFVALMNTLRDHDEHRTHGILIAKNGRLVFEQYFAGFRRHAHDQLTAFGRDTIHDLASVTKSITATLLGTTIDRGIITSVHRNLFEYFPEYADLNDGTKDGITLEHVVTMTAGLEWDEWSYALTDDRNDLVQFNQATDPLGFALAKPMVAVPGTHYAYSGANSMLLGDVIRRTSGVRLDSLAQDFLFTPLGVDTLDWKYYGHISPDLVAAHGDLELRPRDMLKLGQLYLQDGVWNGERIISPRWIDASATAYTTFPPGHFQIRLYGLVGYSYGWWPKSDEYGEGAFAASGWGDQAIIVMPEFDMVAVFTGGSYWEPPLLMSHEMMVDYVLPAIQTDTP